MAGQMSQSQKLVAVAVLLAISIFLLRTRNNSSSSNRELEWRPHHMGRNLKMRKPQVIKGRGKQFTLWKGV